MYSVAFDSVVPVANYSPVSSNQQEAAEGIAIFVYSEESGEKELNVNTVAER